MTSGATGPAAPQEVRAPGRGGSRRGDVTPGPALGWSWRRAWPLGAWTAVVMALAVSGVVPTWSGLLHLVALPPLDLHADVRVLLLEPPSWPVALLVAAAVLTVRVLVLASLLGGVTRRTVTTAAAFYLLVLGPVTLAAFAQTAGAAVLYARLFWPGLGILAAVVLLAAALPWQGGRLRRAPGRVWRQGFRVDVLVPYLAVVVGLGALAEVAPALVLPLVPVSALATVLAVRALLRAPRVDPAVALATTVVVAGGAGAVFLLTRPDGPQPEDGPSQEGSVLIMSGINSSSGQGAIFDIRPQRLGYSCDQTFYFSYAGPGDGQPQGGAQCEIRTGAPYEPDDTQRPFAEQVEAFELQTADLPRPLTVLAHSHAVWVAWEAVAAGDADADVVVLVGPFPDSPIGYPPADQDGPGKVFGDMFRAFVPVADLVDFNFDPDAPAALELLATQNISREILDRPMPEGTRVLSLTSATDLPLMPNGWLLDVERNACPMRMAHPYLPLAPQFAKEIVAFLEEEPGLSCPPWRDWGAYVSLPFGAPPGAGPEGPGSGVPELTAPGGPAPGLAARSGVHR